MEAKSDPAQALTLIAEFFTNLGAQDVAQYVGRIAVAFYDRAEGVQDPIFSRSKKSKDDPTVKWRGRMWAALGFECLLRLKMSRPAAANHVARKYPKLSGLLRGERNIKTSLVGWYDEFMTKGKTPPAVHLKSFARTYAELKLGDGLSKEEYQHYAKDCFSTAVQIAESIPRPS